MAFSSWLPPARCLQVNVVSLRRAYATTHYATLAVVVPWTAWADIDGSARSITQRKGALPCLLWVKMRRTQCEQIFSGLPSKADLQSARQWVHALKLIGSRG